MTKRVMITGASGMLGIELVRAFQQVQVDVIETTHAQLDVSDPTSVAQIATGAFGPIDWVINAAAYTAVDLAESEQDVAFRVNGLGPAYLAQACAMTGGRLVHISTDFVFDGEHSRPYVEDDPTAPIGAYGRSKLEGELAAQAHLPSTVTVRTSWLYGPGGKCFPKSIVRAWLASKRLRVVSDQIGTPTCAIDLARLIFAMVNQDISGGIYHAAGPESMSWCDFAERCIAQFTAVHHVNRSLPEIERISTGQWPTPARRPKFSALSSSKLRGLNFEPMRAVNESLAEFWSECRNEFAELV